MRVKMELPKVHVGELASTTPVDIYVAEGDDACALHFEDFGRGMGLTTQLWTTRAGLEVLRDKLNVVLVQEPVS